MADQPPTYNLRITAIKTEGPWPVVELEDGTRLRFVGDYDGNVEMEVYSSGEKIP